MRFRVNRRENNLAFVSESKKLEDAQNTAGDNAMYYFFDKEDRRPYKVAAHQDQGKGWVYDTTAVAVSKGRYMYAVGKNGALYIANTIAVHSQFKSGAAVQSAGWLEYERTPDSFKVVIDNCSGHYQPSLEQFLETLVGLNEAGMLPRDFCIKVNKLTTCQTSAFRDNPFWSKIFAGLSFEASKPIQVHYNASNNSYELSSEEAGEFLLDASMLSERKSPAAHH